jgi:hypothetical protein
VTRETIVKGLNPTLVTEAAKDDDASEEQPAEKSA